MGAYPWYPERRITVLDGLWDFAWLGTSKPFDEVGPEDGDFRRVASVPGAFDTLPDLAGQRGTGVYRTRVLTAQGTGERTRLQCDGLGLRGRVFWDGREIAASELPYVPFSTVFAAGDAGWHELAIACDNRLVHSPAALFAPDFDFYGYGGIYRGVRLHRLPACAFDRVRVTTVDLAARSVRLDVRFLGDCPREVELSVGFDDVKPEIHAVRVADGIATFELAVPGGTLWSPESPHLHRVTVAMAGDAIVEQFGLRTVTARSGRIQLNGKDLRLVGFNRHEAHPELGPAVPEAEMARDLQFMKDMGCNFVRGAHYPQHQAFLDLCDRMGFLVWEESMGWNDRVERLVDPRFAALQEEQTRRMVQTSINHPSVILWGFLNEGASDHPDSRPLYARLARAIREEDPTRLVSYASNRCERDLSFAEADVIAMNLYPAWIDEPDWLHVQPFERIPAAIRRMVEFCSAPEYRDKPFLLSEIGTCALYGWHDPHRAGWSEEYQADYLRAVLEAVRGEPRLSGLAIWQLTDTRSFSAGAMRSKARGFNNAGVLDEYRRPKLAYQAVKELLGGGNRAW